jgi:hypothetical protein
MPQDYASLTDDELLAVADDQEAIGVLRPADRARLRKLQARPGRGPDWTVAPTLGAMVVGAAGLPFGGVGAIGGAALGGMLGKGAELLFGPRRGEALAQAIPELIVSSRSRCA